MSTEVADLYVILSARTEGFTKAMGAAAKEGESFQNRIAKVAQAGKLITGAAVLVGAAAVKMAADYQSGLTLLQTAGGESAKNMKTVSDGILNLATATGVGTKDLLEGAYTAEKAMYRGADMLLVLKAATQGAVAEHVDEATAVNALTSVMQSYGYKAKDAVAVENMLVKASGLSKTTYQEFASSLSTVIPIASAAHVSFAQVAGAIATLTQHGTSAQEATQELSNTIRNLQAPNNVAVKAMQQLGLNVTDVESHLGSRGLTGTINLLVDAIGKHLGPSGLVAVDSFKKSASASADLNVELAKMPPKLRDVSQQFLDGKIGYKSYLQDIKNLDAGQYELGKSFIATLGQAKGFNDLLKAGNPVAQTFAAYLKQMMGGATGLNTALMLSGNSASYFTRATDEVAAASKHAGANISTWAQTQATFNVKLARAKQDVEVMAIKVGTKLIPVVEAAAGWMAKHTTIVKDLAIALGVTAAGAVVVWAGSVVVNLARGGAAIVKWALTPLRNLVTSTMETSRTVVAQAAVIGTAQEEEATATETASARMIRAIEANKAAMMSQGSAARTGAAEVSAADTEIVAANEGAAASGSKLTGMFKGIGAAGPGVLAGIAAGAMGEKYAWDQATVAGDNAHSSLVKYMNFASNFVVPGLGVVADKILGTGKNIDGAKFSTDNLTVALVNNSAQVDQVARSWVEAQVQGSGLDVVAAKMGMTTDQLTSVVMRGTHAVGSLEQGWLKSGKVSYQQINTLSNLSEAYSRTTSKVLDLSQRMKLIPTTIHSKVDVDTSQAMWAFQQIGSAFADLRNGLNASVHVSTGLGGRQGTAFAGGGWARGAGTSSSDSIPAWLSNGEYVLSADMLAGRQPVDASVLRSLLTGGSLIAGGGSVGGGGGTTVQVYVQGSVIDTQGLVQAVQTAMAQHGARNPTTYQAYKR